VTPSVPEQIGGLVEVPALAASLTLNKADFIRTGPRGAVYLTYRKAVQEAVSRQLAAWGDARDTAEESRRRATRPLERDLERVLLELADDFPLLATLVERRRDGQRSLPIGRTSRALQEVYAATAAVAADAEPETPAPLDAVKPETQTVPGARRRRSRNPQRPGPSTRPETRGGRDISGSASSSMRGRTTSSWGASSNLRSGSTCPTPPTVALRPRARRATTWRSPSPSRWRRSRWSRRASTGSSRRSSPAGGEAVMPRPSSARARRGAGAGPRSSPAAVSRQS
jgi:hypothetical protein